MAMSSTVEKFLEVFAYLLELPPSIVSDMLRELSDLCQNTLAKFQLLSGSLKYPLT